MMSRQLRAEVADELRLVRREPAALFFSIIMPVMFYALFVAMFGDQAIAEGGLPTGTTMLATFGTYGGLIVALSNPGIGLASTRDSGWLQVMQVSPVPVGVSLAAKVLAVIPTVVGVLIAMTATSAALGVLEITIGQWLLLVAIVVFGALPFALLGMSIGALASPNATTAILNAFLMPAAIASGLWFPFEIMPAWVHEVAQWLPTYHLAQLALVPLEGGAWLPHAMALALTTAILAVVAAMAWRRARL